MLSVHHLHDAASIGLLTTGAVVQQSSATIANEIVGAAIALCAVVMFVSKRIGLFADKQEADREQRIKVDEGHTKALEAHTLALHELLRRTSGENK